MEKQKSMENNKKVWKIEMENRKSMKKQKSMEN